jgi:tRNA pseudouridine38-40 synthase
LKYALIVEYEGTRYSGFQFQKNARTVQEEIETAIARFTGETVRIKAAGRTDAGVHATGQVVTFDSDAGHPTEIVVRALNSHLPDDIAVKEAHEVADTFDPRRCATARTYVYTIDCGATRSPIRRRTTGRLGRRLDVRRMIEAAEVLKGVHDFARFSGPLERPDASAVREIFAIDVREDHESVRIEVTGNAFLPHQVRRMAGALVDVGLGKLTSEDIRRLLEGSDAGLVARALPPQGLCLVSVQYGDSDKLSEGQ